MSTVVVTGRVEESDKLKVEECLEKAGMPNSDLIRLVWHNVAVTGRLPKSEAATKRGGGLYEEMLALRSVTPTSQYLRSLTPQGLKEALGERD